MTRAKAEAEPLLTTEAEHVDTQELWYCGVIDGAPKQNIQVGGVNFPLFTQKVIQRDDGVRALGENRFRGEDIPLYADELARVIEAIKHKHVRWMTADKKRLDAIYDDREMAADGKTPRHRVNRHLDEPLSKYLFMVKKRDWNGDRSYNGPDPANTPISLFEEWAKEK